MTIAHTFREIMPSMQLEYNFFCNFQPIYRHLSETAEDRHIVTMEDGAINRMITLLMTLSDLRR